jgi:hypothetical protein
LRWFEFPYITNASWNKNPITVFNFSSDVAIAKPINEISAVYQKRPIPLVNINALHQLGSLTALFTSLLPTCSSATRQF